MNKQPSHEANVPLVTDLEQRWLGLVNVGGRCSGSLLNRFWALKADYCVTRSGEISGPDDALANLVVQAAWSTRQVIPMRVVRYNPRDAALLFLGTGDFGERVTI